MVLHPIENKGAQLAAEYMAYEAGNGGNGMSSVEFFTVDEVAGMAKVSRATIYRMIAKDEIKPTKFGNATRIHRSQIIPQAPLASGVNSGVEI